MHGAAPAVGERHAAALGRLTSQPAAAAGMAGPRRIAMLLAAAARPGTGPAAPLMPPGHPAGASSRIRSRTIVPPRSTLLSAPSQIRRPGGSPVPLAPAAAPAGTAPGQRPLARTSATAIVPVTDNSSRAAGDPGRAAFAAISLTALTKPPARLPVRPARAAHSAVTRRTWRRSPARNVTACGATGTRCPSGDPTALSYHAAARAARDIPPRRPFVKPRAGAGKRPVTGAAPPRPPGQPLSTSHLGPRLRRAGVSGSAWPGSPPVSLARANARPVPASLAVNRSTGGGLQPVNRGYIYAAVRELGITAQDLRADRLHDEAQASGGDPLRLAHLFGISDAAAIWYCADLTEITTTDASLPALSASPAVRRRPGPPPDR